MVPAVTSLGVLNLHINIISLQKRDAKMMTYQIVLLHGSAADHQNDRVMDPGLVIKPQDGAHSKVAPGHPGWRTWQPNSCDPDSTRHRCSPT